MARERKTVKVAAVVDESGSMGWVQATTIESYGEFLNSLKETPADTRMSLTIFDDEVRHPYTEEYLANAVGLAHERVQYNALSGGGTALYDAFGEAIEIHAKRAAEATLIIMAIITDGDDTSSRTWNAATIKAEVDKRKATGKWRFIWMGPNQKTARDVGINPDDIFELKSGAEGIRGAIAQMSAVVTEQLMLTASATC